MVADLRPKLKKPLAVTLKHLFRWPITVQYPDERLVLKKRYRGLQSYIALLCTGCGICAEFCPQKTIEMIEVDGKRQPRIYAGRCMFCGICVEHCPTRALGTTSEYELAGYDRESLVYEPEDLMELADQSVDISKGILARAPKVDIEKCVGCLECKRVCDWEAISREDVGEKRTLRLDFDKCTFCGKCSDICLPEAMGLEDRVMKEGMEMKWEVWIPVKDNPELTYADHLISKVVDLKFCSHCTACVGSCPVVRLKGVDEPIYQDMEIPCNDCSLCVKSCPRYDYGAPIGIGDYLDVFSARSTRFIGQDGAMATEILVSAMEMGVIDAAIVVDRDEEWKPVLRVATTPREITKGLQTKYALADVLSALKEADRLTRKGLAIVGTPCQIEGFRRVAENVKFFTSKVKLVVGLFCFENFYYKRFYQEFLGGHGITPRDLVRTDMKKGILTVITKDGKSYEFKVDEFEHYALDGCMICRNFLNIYADVSVGGSGSEKGFSSVFVREEHVRPIIDYMREKGYIEEAPPEQIEKVLKVNRFMCKYKARKHPIEPYYEARGIKMEEGDGS
ncbi:MAG: Coenzyme F420 hydrogenase/dehydrogenase, beta subunit C-terminal domain [Candidatus Hydrothermarchaeales archaeon]